MQRVIKSSYLVLAAIWLFALASVVAHVLIEARRNADEQYWTFLATSLAYPVICIVASWCVFAAVLNLITGKVWFVGSKL